MFTKKVKSAFIALAIGLGTIVSIGGTANAEARGGIYFDGPGVEFSFGNGRYNRHNRYRGHRSRSHRRWDRRDRWDSSHYRRNRCSPGKAVRKARRRGLRHAHVVRVNRRGVVVVGRRWGERVVMGFDRSRRCHVRFVRGR